MGGKDQELNGKNPILIQFLWNFSKSGWQFFHFSLGFNTHVLHTATNRKLISVNLMYKPLLLWMQLIVTKARNVLLGFMKVQSVFMWFHWPFHLILLYSYSYHHLWKKSWKVSSNNSGFLPFGNVIPHQILPNEKLRITFDWLKTVILKLAFEKFDKFSYKTHMLFILLNFFWNIAVFFLVFW